MSNILKMKNTIPSNDNYIKSQQSSNKQVGKQTQIDGTNGSVSDTNVAGDKGLGQNLGLFYDSNFGTYIKLLQATPKLSDLMTDILFQGKENLEEVGVGESYKEALLGFFDQMKMTPQQASEFLKRQIFSGIQLKGGFFDLLRQTMNESSSVELRSCILDFVKKYCDMSAKEHLIHQMEYGLYEIKGFMFQSARQELQELINKLQVTGSFEEMEGNIQILKSEIVPYLGQYITNTKNMGTIRNLINLLTYNLARYENGTLDNIKNAYGKLMGYQGFYRRFKGFSEDKFLEFIKQTQMGDKNTKRDFADSFLEVIKLGLKGEAGVEHKQGFQQILQSILLNESVYMPLLHVMLPMEIQGHMIFSELWVDPDANEETKEEGEKALRLFLKFEIEHLGGFDLIMYYKHGGSLVKNKVQLGLYYPEKLTALEKKMEQGLSKILEENNMVIEQISLGKSKEPLTVDKVFPGIYEGSVGVNVRV